MPLKKSSYKVGIYTAINIKCKEATLGGVVARVHVERLRNEVMDLKPNRGLKRKLDSSVKNNVHGQKQSPIKRLRGRPKKFNFQPKINGRSGATFSNAVKDTKAKFKGHLQNKSPTSKTTIKSVVTRSAKRKNTNSVGDEVISFLPVFNNKPKSPVAPYNKKKFPGLLGPDSKQQSSSVSKQTALSANPVVILGSDFSSVIHDKSKKTLKASPKADIENATKSETCVEKFNEVESKENKLIATDKSKSTNGPIVDKKNEKIYALFVNEDIINKASDSNSIGDMDFNRLVRSLKQVKLPGPKWKIRIVVSKIQTITEVTFTNKEAYERCIKFSRAFTGFVITFNKVPVKLWSSPTKITSFNDVSVLLDIIHNIALDDVLLEYQSEE